MGEALTLFMHHWMPAVSNSRLVNISIISDNASHLTAMQVNTRVGEEEDCELIPTHPHRACSSPAPVGEARISPQRKVRCMSVPSKNTHKKKVRSRSDLCLSLPMRNGSHPATTFGGGRGRWESGDSDSDSDSHRRTLVQPKRHVSADKCALRSGPFQHAPGKRPTKAQSMK